VKGREARPRSEEAGGERVGGGGDRGGVGATGGKEFEPVNGGKGGGRSRAEGKNRE